MWNEWYFSTSCGSEKAFQVCIRQATDFLHITSYAATKEDIVIFGKQEEKPHCVNCWVQTSIFTIVIFAAK